MTILLAIVVFIAVFMLLQFIELVNKASQIKKNAIIKHLKSIIHEVSVEKHQGIEYWFDGDDKFLGQGKTFDDTLSVVKSKFPDHIFLFKDQGGLCANTNWQIVPFDELKQLKFTINRGK
jgi:hypothetical protein